MIRHVIYTAVFTVLVACARTETPIGTWSLWSIDGVPAEAGPVDRFELPANPQIPGLNAGDVWTETIVRFSQLQFLSDGEYQETTISDEVIAATPDFFRRSTGRLPFNDSELRGRPNRDTTHILGTWRVFGRDSIALEQSPEVVRARLRDKLRELYPTASDDQLAAALQMITNPPSIRARGRLTDEKLELTN